MGASGWEYVVPYQADLQSALSDLRRRVFAEGRYYSPTEWDMTPPESADDLWNNEYYWEFMGTNGTHSIIDVARVAPYNAEEQKFGTICPLTDDEHAVLFGSARPTRADYDRVQGAQALWEFLGERWTGRAAILWADGKPAEIAFWGFSGD